MADLAELEGVAALVLRAEAAAAHARGHRDLLIRDLRQTTRHTIDEIARAGGVSTATVKAVTRGIRRP